MNIRKALPSEAEVCWDVRNQAIRHGCRECYDAEVIHAWTPEAMPEGYRRAITHHAFFVATDADNQPVATGFLDLSSGSVEAIFTLPSFTGRGLAGSILEVIKQEARQRGYSSLTLSATPNARSFYEKHGFIFISENLYPSELAGASLRCSDMRIDL
ncbi:GNAT family N-acetyltransferase [Pantoea coffeiphila]|uniref:GNAT family N-acetyltransferase n=1 Tax=Pantoea coffeiphila TaxID=1465635 RepID=A0A2S9IFK4_9GAMM|nr:GNAT family N-acetyltransferase [Pantoea coffeiphila]PRD16582.1 GNAT family N-acetyltransferase [Pantoea coffeiphila]